jgi:isocitrate dehydrogenase (NAD+)
MTARRVTCIPGDGIGPEITEAVVRVLEEAGAEIEWEVVEAGEDLVAKFGHPLPEAALDSIRKNRVALKGPITTPIGRGYSSPNVEIRKRLDLYACLRPARSLPGIPCLYKDVDLYVVRENTEGLYSGIEHLVVPGVAETIKIITEKSSLRIAEFAFALAEKEGRKKVTAVHKANIMKVTDGLFLECCRRVAKRYPQIEYEEMIIDATCQQLVMRPQRFDVMLMANFYGDLISDLVAGLVGGLGVSPGANIGHDVAVFEAVHGSAPDIAGKNWANPLALLRSALLMLRHLGQSEVADRIDEAILKALADPRNHTRDLGGQATTTQMTEAIIASLS